MPETDRLRLRSWRPADLAGFAAMNADPEVMEHLVAPLDRDASDALSERIQAHIDEWGYGLWAVEVRSSGELIGYTGLTWQRFEAPFTPAVEIGWRLARPAWGHGYATEAARAALAFGFDRAGLDEIVSMTAAGNLRSRRVMERIGMTHDPADDFDHPNVPVGSSRRRHVLYRIRAGADGPTSRDSTVV